MIVFRSIAVCLSVLCIALPAASASGQRLASTFDVNLQGWNTTGDRPLTVGIALEAVAARRLRPFSHGALVVGGAAALQGVIGDGEVCRVGPPPVPGDDPLVVCQSAAPAFASFTALAGVEATRGLTARLLGGPAVFYAGTRGTALGAQGRVDVATPSLFHIALVISARGAVVPNFEGRCATFVALGLGLGIR
jgi:hypothetical protein